MTSVTKTWYLKVSLQLQILGSVHSTSNVNLSSFSCIVLQFHNISITFSECSVWSWCSWSHLTQITFLFYYCLSDVLFLQSKLHCCLKRFCFVFLFVLNASGRASLILINASRKWSTFSDISWLCHHFHFCIHWLCSYTA